MCKKVIDVSDYQGTIDWQKVKAEGIEGAIICAGYGRGNADKDVHARIKGALDAGIHVGIYWASYAYTSDMAKKEAQYCHEIIKDFKSRLSLPVFFDWEGFSWDYAKKHGVNPTKALITALNKAFCDEIKRFGYVGGYYLNLDYSRNYVDESQLKGYKRWLAWWNPQGETEDCYMWQYSDKGRVNGINGNVDMDTLWGDFTASEPQGGSSSGSDQKPGTGASGGAVSGYTVGDTYTVTASALNVRTGAGTGYPLVGYDNLTADGKKHASIYGALLNGTRVTCLDLNIKGEDVWMQIPSGWCCAIEGDKTYIK